MEKPFSKHSYRFPNQTSFYNIPSQPKKKVVSIPIHFVGSEKTRSGSALKIQKAFRGFRVRKNVKKIILIRREVDEVERKLEERETIEVIKKDAKERLKLNESLMALLLLLDSVRGVDDGVRDFRKSVIRKAVMLQEKIDSIVADIDDSTSGNGVNEGETLDPIDITVDEGQVQGSSDTIDDDDVDSFKFADNTTDNRVNEGIIADKTSDIVVNEDETLDPIDIAVDEGQVQGSSNMIDGNDVDSFKFGDNATDNGVNESRIADKMNDSVVNEGELGVENPNWGKMESETKREEEGNSTKRGNEEWVVGVGGGEKEERKKRKENLLEKMVEENERLMTMVADLCDKNVTQASMICSLSQRVEQLEKAMNERVVRRKNKNNKKKKKKNATVFVNGLVYP